MANPALIVARLAALMGRRERPAVTIGGTVKRAQPEQTNERQRGGGPGGSPISLFGSTYELDRDNRAIAMRDYDLLCDNVPEFARALEIVSTNATSGDHTNERTMSVEFGSGLSEQEQLIVKDTVARLDMPASQKTWCKTANKKGDLFRHRIFDRNGILLRLRKMEPEAVTIQVNAAGDVSGYVFDLYRANRIEDRTLEPWEVSHWAHCADDDSSPYGRSLFAGGGRIAGHRLLTGLEALTYEVLNHCTARNYVMLPRPSDWTDLQREDWLAEIREELKRMKVIDSNGLMNRKAISMLNSEDHLIDFPVDVETGRSLGEPKVVPAHNAPVRDGSLVMTFFQKLVFIVTGTPPEYFGVHTVGEGIGGNRMNLVDLQFLMQLNGEQIQLAAFDLEILVAQCLALGIVPPPGSIKISMPNLRAMDDKIRAEILWLRTQAIEKLNACGIPKRVWWTEVLWDGDVVKAKEKAEEHGFSLTDETPTASVPADEVPRVAADVVEATARLKLAESLRNGAVASSKRIHPGSFRPSARALSRYGRG